ncbi:MAG: Bug family tripartite tricarboxylate transporter substrate binding protein [Burkholderiales bacterium]
MIPLKSMSARDALATLSMLLVSGFAAGIPAISIGQNFPSKPIKIIVPYAPNGLPDVLARVVAQAMSPEIGQQVVIDNKAGASTIIGAEAAAKSPPDGYTLFLMDNNSSSITPAVITKLPYDPVRDFAPITQGVRGPFFLIVNTSLGVNSLQEFLTLARKRPGEINYASPGNATVHHITMEHLKLLAKLDLVHVPYKGVIQVTPGLLANEVSVMFNTLPSVIQHVKAGKLRILATASAQRTPLMPEVPTLVESGFPDLELDTTIGFAAPAGTPRDIVLRLYGAMVKSLRSPEVVSKMHSFGMEVVATSPEQFGEQIRVKRAYYAKLVRDINLKID